MKFRETLNLPDYLDRIGALIDTALDAIGQKPDTDSAVARTVLRLARSSISILKDEAMLSAKAMEYIPPTAGRKKESSPAKKPTAKRATKRPPSTRTK